MPLTNYLSHALINHTLRNTAYTSPTTVYASLYTAAPNESGGGTEVTGGGYARQAVTFGAPASKATDNTGLVDFGTASASWGTIVAVGLHDNVSGGNLLSYDVLDLADQKTVGSGDSASFPIGAIDFSLT